MHDALGVYTIARHGGSSGVLPWLPRSADLQVSMPGADPSLSSGPVLKQGRVKVAGKCHPEGPQAPKDLRSWLFSSPAWTAEILRPWKTGLRMTTLATLMRPSALKVGATNLPTHQLW